MKKLILIILLIIPLNIHAEIHSAEEWTARYLSPCPKIPDNRVCFEKTKRNFKRMLGYKDMIIKKLDEHNLPGWLGIICVIESECTEKAISKAGAVGLFQVMPFLIQHYKTKITVAFGYEHRIRPTIKKSREIGLKAEKNTDIAVTHLKVLYEKYGKDNHKTVLRAYNAGEFRIDCQNPKSKKMIKRCATAGILGKPLKPETLNYYQQLLGLRNILEGYNDYFTD